MDAREVAEKIVRKIFDEAENHMRTLGRDWAIDIAEQVLRNTAQAPAPAPHKGRAS